MMTRSPPRALSMFRALADVEQVFLALGRVVPRIDPRQSEQGRVRYRFQYIPSGERRPRFKKGTEHGRSVGDLCAAGAPYLRRGTADEVLATASFTQRTARTEREDVSCLPKVYRLLITLCS